MHAISTLMNRLFIALFLIFISCKSLVFAQIHELGLFVGGSNYIGEIGSTTFVKPNEMAYGLLYRWNRSPRHAWRFSYMQSKISAQDANASENARVQRDLSFYNNIKELSVGLEFNFFDFNLHSFDQKITPYIYTGVAYTNYDEKYFFGGKSVKDINRGVFALPMILGIKTNITKNYVLGFEVGVRYSFTDNLDGSNPKNENFKTLQFGNLDSKDWYVFSGVTLTYTFGEKPCYCSN